MGYFKQQQIEDEFYESLYKIIARYLGIDELELSELDFEIYEETSRDGFLTAYLVEFSRESGKELSHLELEDGVKVRIHPSELSYYGNDFIYDYEDELNSIIKAKNPYQKFLGEIKDLEEIMNIHIEENTLKNILHRQVYIGLIGTMETYLSETFIQQVLSNGTYFRNFIETHPQFRKRKLLLSEIFNEKENLQRTAKVVMLETIYHNLSNIKNMYTDTFKIQFPMIASISKSVSKRHDLVHRNGKTKNGLDLNVSTEEITTLAKSLNTFVLEIESEINKVII